MTAVTALDTPVVTVDLDIMERNIAKVQRHVAARKHDHDVPFLIECDTGGARNGVQTPEAAFELAKTVMKLPRMRFDGLMTFPNTKTTAAYFTRALELF